jgi:carbonic anhydrase/acetyltransferase-like protein (isoleucine patch superfamily)
VPKTIVIVGSGEAASGGDPAEQLDYSDRIAATFACLEFLGESLVSRAVEDVKRAGIETVTVIADDTLRLPDFRERAQVVRCKREDLWRGVGEELLRGHASGAGAVFIMRLGPYVEVDIADMLRYSEERRESVIRAFDGNRSLDIWAVGSGVVDDTAKSGTQNALEVLAREDQVEYEVRGYVNPLEHPKDFRKLAVDSLNSRCRLRPRGFEVRPGVWMGERATVEKEARIVAPAYIGRDVTIAQQCLITRGSNVECNSLVDYGTVIEDTSVLPNTYVGIGLDVCHSIVDGSRLLNIERGVMLDIEDSAVMRKNRPLAEAESHWWTGFGSESLVLSEATKRTS